VIARRVAVALALAALFAASTAAAGWWTVPVVAFGVGARPGAREGGRRRGPGGRAALAAAAGWALLLAREAARGSLWPWAERLAGVFGIPAVALVAVTVAFAALLAWSAATLGAVIRAAVARGAPRAPLARVRPPG
jgi:hypothetical protein